MERTLLCFGDSNTWGYNPAGGTRYERISRWPGILSSLLGPSWNVIEEGLNGRTTVFSDPLQKHRRGIDALEMLLETHAPLDAVIIMLGTNDAKARFSATPFDIAMGWNMLAMAVKNSSAGHEEKAPQLLLVCPPPILNIAGLTETFSGAPAKSLRFAELCRNVAVELGCYFLDAGTIITADPSDGIHLSAESHKKLAHAIYAIIDRNVCNNALEC